MTQEANIAEPLEAIIHRVHLHSLRTRILIALDEVYPEKMDSVVVAGCIKQDVGRKTVLRELHYLTEKGLVALDLRAEDHLLASITARGRDFLAGDIEEVGLAAASEMHYHGPSNSGG